MQNDAVSEVIGSILLISLVVLAVVIVGVGILSQPPPIKIQELNVIAGNNTTTLFLFHDGGDVMMPGEYFLQIDNNRIYPDIPWRIGDTLDIPITMMPERIQIISMRGGQETLIRTVDTGEVTGGGRPITPGPIPPAPNGTTCSEEQLITYLEENYVNYYSEKLNSDSIYFTRLEKGNKAYVYGYINFTINSSGSYLFVEGNQINLNIGSQISIYVAPPNPERNPEIRFFSVGGKGWSMMLTGTGTDVGQIRVNGNQVGTTLTDSWITSFNDFESSFVVHIQDNAGPEPTRLIIENATVVDGNNQDRFDLFNIRPAEPELLMFHYPRAVGAPIFFIGQMDSLSQNDVSIYP